MKEERPNTRELGFYVALSQVGFEMVTPMLVGLALDYYFEWTPWGTVIGFVLGFVGGFFHLLALLKRQEAYRKKHPPQETQPPRAEEDKE